MATRKQLAALARGRAIKAAQTKRRTRGYRVKRTYKRTSENPQLQITTSEPIIIEGNKSLLGEAFKYVMSALKSFLGYGLKKGYIMLKGGAKGAYHAVIEQSERLTYMKYLLEYLFDELEKCDEKTSKAKLLKLEKCADILKQLTEIEFEENPKLPKRFMRDVYSIPELIKKQMAEKK